MKRKKLGLLTDYLKRGVTPRYIESDGITVLNQKCVRDNRIDFSFARLTDPAKVMKKEKMLQAGDILVNSTGTGTLGRTAYFKGSDESVVVDSHVTIVRPKETVNSRFLAYCLALSEPIIEGMARGATNQMELAPASLGELPIPDLDRKSQDMIAEIVSAYDDLVEKNLRRIELLEESARQLYKEWFVRLRFPGYEHTTITKGIPEGWNYGQVGDLTTVQSGYAFKSKDWTSEGKPVIKIKNIQDRVIDIDNCQCIPERIAERATMFRLAAGDLLIAMTGATVGKTGVMPQVEDQYYLNQRVGIFRPTISRDASAFLFIFFNTDNAQKQILNYAGGAAQPNISPDQIKAIKLLIPNNNIMSTFLEIVEPMHKQRLMLLVQNRKLKEARDLLLPKLMSGEIVV